MHRHFRNVADKLLAQAPRDLMTTDDVGNLHHCLRLALKDNDKLRQGIPVSDGDDCLTLGDLDKVMSEIQDADLRALLSAKIKRALDKKTNTNVIGSAAIK